MLGTFVNAGAVLVGGVMGLATRRQLPVRQQVFLRTLLGVLALFTGFRMVWMSVHGTLVTVCLQIAVALLALVLGNWMGKTLGLQRQSNHLGKYARDRFARAQSTGKRDPSEGFITCAILFCVGPLAILGSLQEGLQNDPRILLLKAGMDALAAFAFAKVFGGGVLLSALPVLAYQGTLTLAARWVRTWLEHPAIFDGFNSVGGLLVAMTSLIILDVRKVPLADYLPALVLGALLRIWIP